MTPFPRAFPRRGEIYTVDFNPARGSEQAGRRPALVVSNDTANQHSPVVIVAAITSKAPSKAYPFIVKIPAGLLPLDSYVLGNQLNTIAKERLEVFRGSLPDGLLGELAGALSISLALN